jgi:hypothetical protein
LVGQISRQAERPVALAFGQIQAGLICVRPVELFNDDHPLARNPARFSQNLAWVMTVMQHIKQQRNIKLSIVKRQCIPII